MDRRQFLAAATGGTLAMTTAMNGAAKPSIIELCFLRMRNTQDAMMQRTNDFLAGGYIPTLERAGARHIGAFTNLIGEGNPRTLLVSEYSDLGAWESANKRVQEDKEFTKISDKFHSGPLPYVRKEVQLLRSFSTTPVIEVPRARPENKTHIFELRTYESNHQKSLARKIRMFDEGEIALFRKLGMIVVFFGEALAGPNLPQLTYMLAYDDLAARDKVWTAFVSSPEWDKMKNQPGVSDGEIVSNISNAILRPLPFSSIK